MAKAKKRKTPKRTRGWFLGLLLNVLILLIFISTVEVLTLRFFDPTITVSIAWNCMGDLSGSKAYRRPLCRWRNLNEISPNLRKAVLAAEDQRFPAHHGFDFIELKQALKDLFFQGRLRGASTITMQVARTVYLVPSRTFSRKLAEAYYTLLIELLWDKERILEIYLNTVDWGPGVIGAEAASMKYFKISADRLSLKQAALLVSILPNPHGWRPSDTNREVNRRHKRIMRDARFMPLIS